jgi:hypothetical protein
MRDIERSAEDQLRGFVQKFEPDHRALIRAVRRKLRKRFPSAAELVYDNYNFFVIGYSPTERTSDAIVSIAAAANGVNLCFLQGAQLSDPGKSLTGSGKQTRFLRLPSAEVLDRPEIDALLTAAVNAAKIPFAMGRQGKLIIRSVSAKQRPRTKAKLSRS